jgi:hypothetical protein
LYLHGLGKRRSITTVGHSPFVVTPRQTGLKTGA